MYPDCWENLASGRVEKSYGLKSFNLSELNWQELCWRWKLCLLLCFWGASVAKQALLNKSVILIAMTMSKTHYVTWCCRPVQHYKWLCSVLFNDVCDLVLQVQAMMQWAVQWCVWIGVAVSCSMMPVTWCHRFKRWCSELFSDMCELVLQWAVQWCLWLGVAGTSDAAVSCSVICVNWCCSVLFNDACDLVLQTYMYKWWCSELCSDVCELVWLGVAGTSDDAVSCAVMCVNWCDLVLQVQAMMQWAVQWCWRCSVLCLSKKNAYHTTSFSSLMELRRIFCRWMVLVHCQIFCQMGGRCQMWLRKLIQVMEDSSWKVERERERERKREKTQTRKLYFSKDCSLGSFRPV